MKKEEIVKMLINLLVDEKDGACSSSQLFETGKKYFIRTVSYHMLGVCVGVVENFVLLDKSLWVANSGRFSNALKDGIEKQGDSELEPYHGVVRVNISSIVDFVEYNHEIKVEQK